MRTHEDCVVNIVYRTNMVDTLRSDGPLAITLARQSGYIAGFFGQQAERPQSIDHLDLVGHYESSLREGVRHREKWENRIAARIGRLFKGKPFTYTSPWHYCLGEDHE